MKKGQQGAAVAICVIGLLVLAVGAGLLIDELRNERQARKGLEQESAQLQAEIDGLKTQYRGGIIITETSGIGMPSGEGFIELINSADVTEDVEGQAR